MSATPESRRDTEPLEQLAGASFVIAHRLGGRETWDNPAEILDEIAQILVDVGYPHPGAKYAGSVDYATKAAKVLRAAERKARGEA